ncbi:unnamed protein product [Diamesa serratosioi]
MFKFLIFILCLQSICCLDREKRFLLFPQANPTRHQFVAGIGVPTDLDPESLIIGYVFKAQYFLPYNVSQLRPQRITRDVKYESYNVDAAVVGDVELQVEPTSQTFEDEIRWMMYRTLEYILNTNQLNGKHCVLKAICESAQIPFTHESGLLGELFHILFTPSTSNSYKSLNSKNEYSLAETYGRDDEPCEKIYSLCKQSILDIFSNVY